MDILFEDNHIIVVLKPQNVPSQPDATGDTDMLTMVKNYIKEKYNKPGEAFVGLVHRLDRPTGGVMVFAKTSKAASRLSDQLKNGDMHKSYLAVVQGTFTKTSGTLVDFLQKNERTNTVSVVGAGATDAKRAELKYRVIGTNNDLSFVIINLLTGRSHQIRAQMAHIGHPLYSDKKYGATVGNGNLALWAYNLTFTNPTTQVVHHFQAYPPKVMPWSLFSDIKLENEIDTAVDA